MCRLAIATLLIASRLADAASAVDELALDPFFDGSAGVRATHTGQPAAAQSRTGSTRPAERLGVRLAGMSLSGAGVATRQAPVSD